MAGGGAVSPRPAAVALQAGGEAPRLSGPTPEGVVERTFAWLSQARHLNKDYERLPETGEAIVYGARSRIMLRRLMRAA